MMIADASSVWIQGNIRGSYFQGFCGADSVSIYSIYIFKKSNVALNEYVLSVLLQVGFTVGYITSVPFMGHVGRRPQYFVSSILLATSMVVLGASLYALVSNLTISTSIFEEY